MCPNIGIKNGQVSYSNSTYLDSVATITCKATYKRERQKKLSCSLDESWSHPIPRCVPGN